MEFNYEKNETEAKTRRVQLVMQPSFYEKIKAAADKRGASVNDFFCQALDFALDQKAGIWEIKPVQTKIAKLLSEDLDHQTIEEMAELIQALCKLRRANGQGQPTEQTVEGAMAEIYEELTDVIICLKEFIWLHGISLVWLEHIEREKIARTVGRMNIKGV